MIYYRIDPVTQEFAGAFPAQVDPLETMRSGRKTFCGPPQDATKVAPPAVSDSQVAVWTGKKWTVKTRPPIAADEPPQPSFIPGAVKDECRGRVHAVLSAEAQRNLTAHASVGMLSRDHLDAYRAGLSWIAKMRQVCRDLIAAQDITFGEDKHWPSPPASVAELARSF